MALVAVVGGWLAGQLIAQVDYNGDGQLSVDELLQDRGDMGAVMATVRGLAATPAGPGFDQAVGFMQLILKELATAMAGLRPFLPR